MKINKTFRYRIYPTEDQKVLLAKHFGAKRFVLEQGLNNFNNFSSGCGIQSESKQKLVEALPSKVSLRSKKPSDL